MSRYGDDWERRYKELARVFSQHRPDKYDAAEATACLRAWLEFLVKTEVHR